MDENIKKQEAVGNVSELSDLLADCATINKQVFDKVRIAWAINERQGCGEWHDVSCADALEKTIETMNKIYGQGSHFLNYGS